MRADLISLQTTAQLLNRTQGRLSSGKQVNSAVDDPSKYFAARDHLDHASDLSARKSDMGEAIQAVKAANQGITSITGLINQAQGLVQSAGSANATTRASLAAQFNTLRTQIDQLASDSGYNGKNFLLGDSLNVLFNETGSSLLTVTGFAGTSSGMGIMTAARATGSAYSTPEILATASLAQGANVVLAHSGVLDKQDVTVTQTMAYAAEALATRTAAASLSGQSVTLAHAGVASNVTVYETIAYSQTAAIASANATAAAVSAGSATFTVTATMSAMPATINLTADRATVYTAEALAGAASAASLSGQSIVLSHVGVVSSVTVYQTLSFSAAAAITAANVTAGAVSAGSATVTLSPILSALPATITVKAGSSTLTAGTSYTATFASGRVTVTLLTAQTAAIDIRFNYDVTLSASGDYTISTGTGITAASITFSHDLTGTVKVDYTSTVNDAALTRGTDFTATFDTGTSQVTISLLQAQTSHVDISFTFDKTLSVGTDYTISTGTSATAASITFSNNFSGAVNVDYSAKTTVATGDYTVATGGTGTAGSLTFNAAITGQVDVTYSVNRTLWGTNAAIQTDMANLNTAIILLRTQAASMAANLSVITTRQDWSAGMISNLQTGSDNLTLADMNEEGANMLALQTRQQLGIQALALASQANQSIMRLFG
jgi:flagellin-like hook-associated protein FlgL